MDYENIPGNGRATSVEGDGNPTQMVPEIAAAATAAARTGGVPLIADGNGVIVLPAGATLDDIKVVGRDLVITLDNGQVFVIPEGAVYVPQIVIDGVAVPPLNLAALLIGDEPIQPAAGLPRSSGNNFFEAAGPIQAAHPLGDLLPPTQFGFVAQTNLEVIPQPIDRNPTLAIVTVNQPVGATDATANVAESGLPARAGEPAGSNAAANTEVSSGTILFNSPDGITSLTINGVALTGVGQSFTSPRGTLTITSFDPVGGTANFTYTLTDNVIGSAVADQFTVVLTDPDGDTATSTLTINVADDAPTARNDTDAVPAATFTAQTGNVITGVGTTSGAAGVDTLGADNAAITRIASNAIAANTDTSFDGAGNLQVAGQFGTLTIKADGSYSYTRAAGSAGGVSDAFTYTLTDADGSASTATLTIAIADAAPVVTSLPIVGSASTIVAESGLPARTGEAPGSNAPAPTETTSGTITFAGGDGPVTATINGVAVAVGAVVTTPSGTLTVTAFNPATGTIGYTFTLADNTAGDTTSVTFNLVVTDVDGDAAPGTFTITVTDDVPLAVNDSTTQATENAAVTVNALGNDTPGADSVAFSAVAAVPGTLSGTGTLAYNNNGTFTYTPGAGEQGTVTFAYTITDGDGDTSRATVTITLLADSTPTVSVAGDNTVSEAALPARGEEPAGSNAASPDETAVGTITVGTGGDTIASLVINGTNVTNGGTVTTAKGALTVTATNGAYSYSYTLADNTLADPDSDSFAITVTDSDGDTASTSLVIAIADDTPTARDDAGSVAAGTYGPISGSVTANDTPGADGIVVLSYARGDTSALAGSTIQGQYGTLSIAANGTYSYTRDAGTPGGVSDSFAYTVRDGDGDPATANLVITIADSATTLTIPVAGTPGATQVLEAGLPAGSAAATTGEFASGTFSFTAPDGPATVTIGGTVVTTVGQTIVGSFGTLTITSIASGSIGYTYQLTTRTVGDTTSDAFAVVVADKDNDSSTGTLTIAIVDDVPTARADLDSVKEDGPTLATGNVVTAIDRVEGDANTTDGVADTKGADGASVTAVAFLPVAGGTTAGTVGTGLAGAYGTLTLTADGGYSYVLNNANAAVQGLDDGETLTETFRYTLTDGDGDLSPTTLTITINGTNDAPVVGTGAATVSEEGLAGANADAVGTTDTTNNAVASGTISITDADVEPSTVTLGDPGAVLTSGGVTVTWSGIGTATLTGSAGNTPVIRVAIDNLGAYTVTLLGPVDQATANVEDTRTFSVPVNVSDGTATVPTTLTVTIEDDSPLAASDTDAVKEDGPTTATGNVLTGVGADGNVAGADSIGADGAAAGGAVSAIAGGTVGSPLAGTYGSLTLLAGGGYVYTLDNTNALVQGLDKTQTLTETFAYTIRDGDGDTSPSTLTITINGTDDGVTLTGLNTAGGEKTVFEANLSDGSAPNAGALTQTGTFTTAGIDGIATIVVGGKTVFSGGAFVAGQSVVTAQGTLTITAVTPVKDAVGDTVSATVAYSYTLNDNTLAHPAAGNDTLFDSFAVTVTDSDGSVASDSLDVKVVDDVPTASADVDSVTEDGALIADGNVITGTGGSDANLTDGARDTQGADGAVVSAVSFGSTVGAVGTPLAGTYGSLTLLAGGGYVYTLDNTNALVQGLDKTQTLTETFAYTLRDGDGDTSPSTLTITINGTDDGVTLTGLATEGGEKTVFEANLSDGSAPNAGALTQTGTFTTAGIDGIATIVVGGKTVFSGGAFVAGQSVVTAQGTLTITAVTPVKDAVGDTVSATVAYSYTLNDNTLAHPAAGNDSLFDSFAVTVTDSDGTAATDSLDVKVVDDVPAANADTNMVSEGDSTTGNVLTDGTDDVFGADGAATTVPAGGVVLVNGIAPGTPIVTALGTLTLKADGTYTYVAKANTITTDAVDSFTYTIRDADGDLSPTTLAITVKAVNGTVADTDVDVDESGLATIGSQAVPNGEFDTNGQITVTGATGTFTYTLTSSPLTPYGTLTLNSASGAYSYTLTRPFDNADANDGRVAINGVESYGYRVTDQFGNVIGTGSIAVNVTDDIPTAIADTAITVAEDGANVGGNLLTNDTQGADGATVTSVKIGATTTAVPAAGTVTITTATGVYTFKADGTWTFNPDADQSNNTVPVNAGFTYTITDGDGDQSSAAQAISIIDGANPLAGTSITLTVDDQNLATGSTPAATPPVTSAGTITFTQGSDAISTIVFDTDVSTLTAGNLAWTRVSGTQIVGKDVGSGLTVITLDLVRSGNSATVTATLSNNFDAHPVFTADDLAQLGFVNVVATDSDGDFVKTAVNVAVSDDVPTARADSATQGAENTAIVIDVLANDTFGADGVSLSTGVTLITGPSNGSLGYSATTGQFTYTPSEGAGSGGNLTDSFTYRIIDGDGDFSTATVSITLKPDSAPSVKTTTNLGVDEDGFPAHNPDGGTLVHPTETAGSNSLSDTSGSAVVNFGNDVPSNLLASIVLVDNAAYDTQLKTLDGVAVTFALESGALVGRSGGTEVIRIAITGATTGPLAGDVTYTYSTTLSQPVQHAIAGSEDTASLVGVTFQVTDRDTDTTTGSFNVAILDDVPSIDVTKGADEGVLLTTQDADSAGVLTDTAVSAAKFGSVFALASNAGADGTATAPALTYALAVTGAASGLTSHGATITLYKLADGSIVGSTAGTAPTTIDATVIFGVAVASDGTVTLSQYQQIDHAAETTTITPFDDQFAILADGKISLTASATITDRDGDTVSNSETIDLGGNIRFADDGPSLSAVAAGATVSVDETNAGVNFAAPVSATSATAVITATSAFGADGPFGNTAAAGTTYGLTITGNGTTPLQTAVGNSPITLFQTNATTITGKDSGGATAFTLVIGTDGRLTLTQNLALEHAIPGSTSVEYNDALSLAGLVNATITLKDFDGDTAFASQAIGGSVTFLDDGVDAVLDTGSVPAGSSAAIMGNVLGNDYRGADGSAITLVTNTAAMTSDSTVDGSGNYVLNGQYGTLTLNAATGAYTYARTSGAGGGSSEVFTYTLTDNDGDFDSATLTISIGDLLPVATTASAAVDDEGLANGITDILANGDIDANTFYAGDTNASEAIFTGTLGGTPGDGTSTFLFGAALTGTPQLMGQETVTYTVSGGGSLLTAAITGGSARTGTLFTVQITNQATGAYTLTLAQPVLHLTLDGLTGDNLENDVDITIAYQLLDADLDLSTAGVLSVKFDDDIPTAFSNTNTVAEGAQVTGNVLTDGTPDAFGADGPTATTPAGGVIGVSAGSNTSVTATGAPGTAITTILGTLTLNANGGYTYVAKPDAIATNTTDTFTYSIRDADGDVSTTTLTITLTAITLTGQNVTGTVNEAALDISTTGLDLGAGTITGSNPGSTAETVTGTITVTGGSGITFIAQPVSATTYGLFELKADGTYTYTLTKPFTTSPAANDGATIPALAVEQFSYTAMDANGNTVMGTVRISIQDDVPSAVVTGNAVLSNSIGGTDTAALDSDGIANNLGADGGTVRFDPAQTYPDLTSGGEKLVYTVSSDGLTLTGSIAGGTTVLTVTLNTAGATPTYTTTLSLPIDVVTQVDFNDGQYNFTGGNLDWTGFVPIVETLGGTPNDNGSPDLLLTPAVGGVAGGTVNTTATIGGISGGASVGSGETFRIDFVTDLRGDPASSGGGDYGTASHRDHVYDGHYIANGATALFKSSTDSTVNIVAKFDDDKDNTTTLFETVVGDGVPRIITQIRIAYFGVGSALLTPTTTIQTVVVNGHNFTYQLQGDGSVNVGGVAGDPGSSLNGTNIAVFTTNGFNSVEYKYVSGDTFQIGDFGGSITTPQPTSFSLPIVVIDGDGDRAASYLDITLAAPGVTQDASNSGSAVTLTATVAQPHLIGSDFNDTLIGNAGANVLVGGLGADTLTGGAGSDTFVIDPSGILSANDDAISDYGTGDVIDLRALFGSLGNLAPTTAAQALASIKLVNNATTGTNGILMVDADGTGPGTTFVQVAILSNNPASIQVLFDFSEAAVSISRTASPIALDLDGGGVQFEGLAAGTTFNYGDDGSRVGTAWVGKGDGLLAIDLNGNHQVDSGKEIVFSTGALTDLQGLAAQYDTNHDGKLDAADADFAKFGVWQDANGNGVSDAGEFHTLGELGIVSIGLVSDGVAYSAAGGDVTVAGSSTYTRADGSTGAVADAAFATAPIDKMEAKTAELAAANAAAAGVLAAAVAAVVAMPAAAAETAPATVDGAQAPAALSIQALPATHEELRPASDALTSESAKLAPSEAASHSADSPTAASSLAASVDHAAGSPAEAAIAEHVVEAANPISGGFSGDAGQLMDALLAAAQSTKAGVAGAGDQHAQDLAAVQEAFGDSHGSALVDAMVDHFAGTQTALAAGGEHALAALFASQVGGSESFGPAFDLNQMLSDMSAHAAAQV